MLISFFLKENTINMCVYMYMCMYVIPPTYTHTHTRHSVSTSSCWKQSTSEMSCERTMRLPQEERERLLKQVKADNQEIASIEKMFVSVSLNTHQFVSYIRKFLPPLCPLSTSSLPFLPPSLPPFFPPSLPSLPSSLPPSLSSLYSSLPPSLPPFPPSIPPFLLL